MVGVILLTVIVVAFVPFPYTATEAIIVKEPYEAQETYTTQEAATGTNCPPQKVSFIVTTKSPINPNMEGGLCTINKIDAYEQCLVLRHVTISNTDIEDGIFRVKCIFTTNIRDFSPPITISSGQKLTWNCLENYDLGQTSSFQGYEVDSSLKKNIQCIRTVEKNKTITKYKDLEKERNITKYAPLLKRIYS